MPEQPWIQGQLHCTGAVLAEVYAEAERTYPSEGCGFLFGPASAPARLTRFAPAVNEADKYHALDPVQFPRTSKEYFKINELKAGRLLDEGARNGEPLKVIFHSHVDSGDHFSAEDAMTFAHEGQLMWPCAFLVVSVREGKAVSHQLHVHVPGTDTFAPSLLQVVD